ncbi:hypothetical protein B0J13DRAFT_681338 [Dactylonectria estremocensis]|uniref:Uncharacterized protein n=1 Tax=Dactylonectria estremocensis TaxID=1079267 RepID=A0A9P9IDG3_9HYPO|nr:hypothetical protein B0J13DRAFT_681338 [Dactylonectria estremocensis]
MRSLLLWPRKEPTEQQPVSLIESANRLARERVEEYNAKLKVFQAFYAKFEEAAKQFTTGPEREFAQKFADSFLDSWNQGELTDAKSAPVPIYSAIGASPPAANNALAHQRRHHQQNRQQQQQQPPHRQGQPTVGAPPREISASSSGWTPGLRQEPTQSEPIYPGNSEWIHARSRGYSKSGAAAIETKQEWFTHLVSDYPCKLTGLYGNEADSDAAMNEGIEIQTGLKPVNIRPTRRQPDDPLTKTLLVSFLEPVKKF